MPGNAQAHLELGLAELENMASVDDALASFKSACRLNPRLGVAWFFAGVTNFRLGKFGESVQYLKEAERRGRRTPAAAEMIGDCHYNLAEFAEAVRSYERALKLAPRSAIVESKCGLAKVRLGLAEAGLHQIRQAILQQRPLAEAHDRLILSLTWLGRVSEAALAAEDKLRSVKAPSPTDFTRAASLWTKVGNQTRAVDMLHIGLQTYRDDSNLSRALNELVAHTGSLEGESEKVLSSS